MKVAVTSTGPTIGHYVGTHFRRSAYLLIIDPLTMTYETMINPVMALPGAGAEKLFRHILLQADVETLLTGKCGSDIFKILGPAGVRIVAGITGPAGKAVEQLKPIEFSRPA